MGDVIRFPEKKAEINDVDFRRLTPELVKEYTETIKLVIAYQDDLSVEDWKSAFSMMLSFNHIILGYIEKMEE